VCNEAYQRFPGHSFAFVSARNYKISENKRQHRIYSKTLVCTHHGYKCKPKGSSERQHKLVRFTGCTADPALLDDRATMRKAGAYPPDIFTYVRKQTGVHSRQNKNIFPSTVTYILCISLFPVWLFSVEKACTLRDVHNIIQSLKRDKRHETSDFDRVKKILDEFCSADACNSAEMLVDPTSKVLEAVVFINRSPECSGCSIQTLQLRCLRRIWKRREMMKETNATLGGRILFKHIVLLLVSLSGPARNTITLSVSRAEMAGQQVGARVVASVKIKSVIKEAITALIYAKSKVNYLEYEEALLYHPVAINKLVLRVSFINHSDVCKEQWTIVTFRIFRTTSMTALKQSERGGEKVIKKPFYLDEVVSTVKTLLNWAENAYLCEINCVGSRPQIDGEDQELSAMAMKIRSHAFKYVKAEYKFAIVGETHYTFDMFKSRQARVTHD
ncbi:hypothetical protein GN958_ATG05765, partial [Phytophthora infestans]